MTKSKYPEPGCTKKSLRSIKNLASVYTAPRRAQALSAQHTSYWGAGTMGALLGTHEAEGAAPWRTVPAFAQSYMSSCPKTQQPRSFVFTQSSCCLLPHESSTDATAFIHGGQSLK